LTEIMRARRPRRHNGASMSTPPADRPPAPGLRRVNDDARHPRLARELATLTAMFEIHCRDRHGSEAALCEKCAGLLGYATRRLDRCVFGDEKPTCANCTVHCYAAAPREEVRVIMRYAGPRMMTRHPVLAVRHLLDGRRPAPALPTRPAARGTDERSDFGRLPRPPAD
jgi:hypothetical protein